MDFRHYTDTTAGLAVDLANVFAAADPVPTAAELEAVLDAYDLHDGLDAAQVARLGELAATLRAAFAAPDAHTGAQVLNELLARAQPRPWISEHDDADPHLHYAPQDADVVDQVAASTAMSLAIVLCDHGQERLGQCAAVDCDDVFIDTSRSAKRRYCSAGCSNRSNVREHRARARESAD